MIEEKVLKEILNILIRRKFIVENVFFPLVILNEKKERKNDNSNEKL